MVIYDRAAMPSDRPKLVVQLDEDSLDAWRSFAEANGITMAALAEAVGRRLVSGARPPAWQRQLVDDARRIAAERRDRRPAD